MRRSASVFAATIAITLGYVSVAPPGVAQDGLDAVRKATARFHSITQAERAGYEAEPVCVAHPTAGGMGVHAINGALMGDPAVDATRPEIILYEPQEDGKLTLIGVEYLVFDADQDLGTDADRPSLFGVPFDGPMPGHFPGMPVHYDLHVWVWRDSPTGTFVPFTPAVECP